MQMKIKKSWSKFASANWKSLWENVAKYGYLDELGHLLYKLRDFSSGW